jgi:hypothetical protein
LANRPCKPDSDWKWIWQTLLPDTPMPACGAPDKADAQASDTQSDKNKPLQQ